MELVVGRLLQVGVVAAAVVVLAGAGLALAQGRHPSTASFRVFHPASTPLLRSVHGAVRGALSLDGRATMQLGLVLLVATPIARVALTLVAFLLQRDRLYVLLTTVVLALLLYGLAFGG